MVRKQVSRGESTMVDKSTQWYPYVNVQPTYFDLSNTVDLPRKICDYLIDAPKNGYVPQDNNAFSRCRLWKYLYYDGARPLDNPLPTIAEKMSVVFNPEKPTDPPTDKGYRLIPQVFVKQEQEIAQTRIMCFIGRTVPSSDEFKISVAVRFLILTHYTYEANTKTEAYSRALAIEQAIIEAFHGVNMEGIGTFYMSRGKHPDCGSEEIYDGNTNIGRKVTLALEIATTSTNGFTENINNPCIDTQGKIKLA